MLFLQVLAYHSFASHVPSRKLKELVELELSVDTLARIATTITHDHAITDHVHRLDVRMPVYPELDVRSI